MESRLAGLWMVVVLGLLLAGCQGRISVDLTTTPAADVTVRQLVVGVLGLEFVRDDGSTETLELEESEPVDLIEFQNGSLLTLFTDEELAVGVYTGVRLLFDVDGDSHFLVTNTGARFPVVPVEGAYAVIDYTVEEDKTSHEDLTLTLDIRQSLSFDDNDVEYTLAPVLRSVASDEAAVIRGTVDIACPVGTSLLAGGAVYLFRGEDVVPDDRDGGAPDPYATTSLSFTPLTAIFDYQLLDLPAGNYTIAATCSGNAEDPLVDDAMTFSGTRNVQLKSEDVLTLNLTN